MIKISKNFLSCSFLPNIPYTVSQFLQNGGRVKQSYNGIGGDTNLRLLNLHDLHIWFLNLTNYKNFSTHKPLTTNPQSLLKMVAQNQRRKEILYWCDTTFYGGFYV